MNPLAFFTWIVNALKTANLSDAAKKKIESLALQILQVIISTLPNHDTIEGALELAASFLGIPLPPTPTASSLEADAAKAEAAAAESPALVFASSPIEDLHAKAAPFMPQFTSDERAKILDNPQLLALLARGAVALVKLLLMFAA